MAGRNGCASFIPGRCVDRRAFGWRLAAPGTHAADAIARIPTPIESEHAIARIPTPIESEYAIARIPTTMSHLTIGTAGHVDHGKSALVEALTGVHPDRLQEERARGMTIDLGFAFMSLGQRADGSDRRRSGP